MATTYKVVKGDTLWEIVQKPAYKNLIAGNTIQAKINTVAKINNLKDPDLILIGQTLKLSGSTTKSASTTSNMVSITHFGALASNERRLYAAWTWSKDGTKEYECKWTIATKVTADDVIWTTGQTEKVTDKACFYDVPDGIAEVRFTVRALDSEGKALSDWLDPRKNHKYNVYLIEKPPAPEVTIQTDRLWASIFTSTGDFGGNIVQFEVYNSKQARLWTTSGYVEIVAGRASWVAPSSVPPGQVFTARCRIIKSTDDDTKSDWSDWSTHVVARPGAPEITKLETVKDDQGNLGVRIEWKVNGADSSYATMSHEVTYVAKDPNRFNETDEATTITVENGNAWEIYGITIGEKYFFKVRGITTAVGGATGGDASYWSDPVEIVLGSTPDAPTTWSSSSTVIFGDTINLYWVHNTMDGSSEAYAQLIWRTEDMVDPDGSPKYNSIDIINESSPEHKDKTRVYEFDTNNIAFKNGAEIEWAVSTAGITGEEGPFSETRSFKVFIEPVLDLTMSNLLTTDGYDLPVLARYPIQVTAGNAMPDEVQSEVGYTVEIKAGMQYETVNYRGETVVVAEGETIFTRHYDISGGLLDKITATDVDLANNVQYSLICTMAMDSGLVSTAFIDFIASFDEVEYPVGATILLNQDTLTATIHPTVEVESEVPIANIRAAVFRREHDGGFVTIAEDMRCDMEPSAVDMHPSLDIPRYRIVVTNTTTGAISFADVIGPQFKNRPVVIQWEEEWQNYDYSGQDNPQVVSCLKLPYNIDIADKRETDVSLVNYIGREHPVSYYGTHLNESATWNVVIDAEDKETIYALRRLSRWKGDVYVREPSGTGYWANVKVSFSQKHRDVSIPVTLTVTRVEGGA